MMLEGATTGAIMRMSRQFIGGAAVLVGGVAALLFGAWRVGHSQTPPASAAKPASAQPIYYPSMGDMMTMLIQPRHLKLALAGKAQNWVYASYELSELRNAFGRITHTMPVYRTMDTASMIMAMTERPLNALDHAIIARDAEKFATAYAELTQACNACHASQQHPMIVIKVPDRTMFPDQDFRPTSR
jgi:hypothetical protein